MKLGFETFEPLVRPVVRGASPANLTKPVRKAGTARFTPVSADTTLFHAWRA